MGADALQARGTEKQSSPCRRDRAASKFLKKELRLPKKLAGNSGGSGFSGGFGGSTFSNGGLSKSSGKGFRFRRS